MAEAEKAYLKELNPAQYEGVVPGGGMTLVRVANDLAPNFENEEQATALSIFKKAMISPFCTMAKNAGLSPDVTMLTIQGCDPKEGVDFTSGEKTNLFERGIIDPAKVTRCALKNAVSVAATLLLTNHSVVHR